MPATDIPSACTRAQALAAARRHIPLAEARLLLLHLLGISRASLMAHDELPLDPVQAQAFEMLTRRRAAGEPIAYLLGTREFFGRPFRVAPGVLIPRPETELLVELSMARHPRRILDLGTGSGVLAVTLALECPTATVTAGDLSPEALAIAQDNAQRLEAQVRFLRGSWYQALPADECFDLIVANPPYIAPGDPHLSQGDLRFEPISALVGQDDGLGDIRRIVAQAGAHLEAQGWLLFEHGYDQGAAARSLLTQAGFTQVQTWHDLADMERVSGGQWPPLSTLD